MACRRVGTMRVGRAIALTMVLICGAAVFAPTSSSYAHTWTDYYAHKWAAASDPRYWFDDALPDSSDFRNRIRENGYAWNAQGGPGALDFLPESIDGAGRNCSIGFNKIEYRGLAQGVSAGTAVCWYSSGMRYVYGFDITFSNTVTRYSGTGTPPSGQIDVLAVATHEFGHATGFGANYPPDHFASSDPICDSGSSTYATMCAVYHVRYRTLGSHDIHTLEGVY